MRRSLEAARSIQCLCYYILAKVYGHCSFKFKLSSDLSTLLTYVFNNKCTLLTYDFNNKSLITFHFKIECLKEYYVIT